MERLGYDPTTGEVRPVGGASVSRERLGYDPTTGQVRPVAAPSLGRAAASGAKQGLAAPAHMLDLLGRGVNAVLPGNLGEFVRGTQEYYREQGGASLGGLAERAIERAVPYTAYTPQSQGERYAQAAVRGPLAAATVAPTALASLPAAGLLLASGATGELGSQFAHEKDLGMAAEIGAGIVGGMAPGGVASLARSGIRNLPGGAFTRARGTLDEIGAVPRDPNAPGRVRDVVQSGYEGMRADTKAAYDQWRASAGSESLPSQVVTDTLVDASQREARSAAVPSPILAEQRLEQPFTGESLESLRQQISGLRQQFARSGNDAEARRMAKILEEFEGLEDQLAALSGNTQTPVLLKEARAARRRQGEVETGIGRDTLVDRGFLDEMTMQDDPAQALYKVLSSKGRPVEALRQMRTAAGRDGPEAVERLNADLRGSYLDFAFSRGASVGGPTHKAPAAWKRVADSHAVGKEILGERAYARLRESLESVAKREDATKLTTKIRTKFDFKTQLMVALGGGGALGGLDGVAYGIGGVAAGHVLGAIANSYGEKAARRVAMEALADPDLLRQVQRKVGSQEGDALAQKLMGSLARRGLVQAGTLTPREQQ